MSQTAQPESTQFDQQLSAFFDDELEGDPGLAQAIAEDSELRAKLADLEFMQTVVSGVLTLQADRVPEARFEQIWDGFERALEREARLQTAAEDPPTVWERFVAWVRPLRIPLATAGAAGILAIVVVTSVGSPGEPQTASNTPVEAPSDQPTPAEPGPTPPGRVIAVAPEHEPEPLEALSNPEPGEAEIKKIEFGGRTGTISQVEGNRGTTTVIWVTEDEEPVDTERSL